MAHTLIVGMTESGKTYFARELCAYYRAHGWETIVLDPLRDPRWAASFITSDCDEFLRVVWASRKCMCFLDEGAQSVGRYNVPMQAAATQSRHWGHSCHFISQGAVQLAPIVRDQCKHLVLFGCGRKAAAQLAEEWNCDELLEAPRLRTGEYVRTSRFGDTYIHRLAPKKAPDVVGSQAIEQPAPPQPTEG